jgi:GNAT superfamily N-acetyltransferase
VETNFLLELIGYIASILVAISLMMSSVLKLRIINLVGALFFTAYGLLIQAYPVAVVNFFIVLINLYYLNEMRSTEEYFRLLEVEPASEYLNYFLDFHTKDIQKFQPGFNFTPAGDQLAFFVLRNLIPAGLVIGQVREGVRFFVKLDYVIPGYRDFKIGKFVFSDRVQAFRERGIRQIYTEPGNPAHARYLQRMGFHPEPGPHGENLYCLQLP